MQFDKNQKLVLNKETLEQYANRFDNSTRKEFIGEMLRYLREMAGLTQTELCALIGIKSGTYSTYENETRETPAEIIVRLSLLYDIPCDLILQKDRFSKEKFVSAEQFNQLDAQLDELREEVFNKQDELNPEFKSILETMVDAFGDVAEKLKDFNENAKLNDNK